MASGPGKGGGAMPDAAIPVAPPLVVEHIAKSYVSGSKVTPVIGDLSFTLGRGEIISVVGPSGCGKSTLLNVICGLIRPDAGSIRYHGRDLKGQQSSMGYMLQKDLLLPWRSALANVMLGTEIRGVPRRRGEERARALLDQLGLDGFADNYPATLSGGMRQRVALARTLVNDPDVLLLDEPFAALDFQTKLLIEGDTVRLVRDGQRSVLLITHDIEEAVSIADRVLVLSQRPTRIKASYQVSLDCARDDMIAARQSRGFSDYVRRIWTDLDVVHA
ncbi:ABC transporter ATP-binding protein [Labrys monachus]|uniref:NitT/TauT family transport system ATP-binding protein n=1 Tax=Labrys monachus TaxID=217067 RepID=A0ABU0FAL2_9HYPH|nr:ABC transporter ATP-binding protein [Labrys monachus]MDQ0391098.1 NitT/TauT family transport system ATP-binding protein [Labrys monachus]